MRERSWLWRCCVGIADVNSLAALTFTECAPATASFGNPMQWSTEANKLIPNGHAMTMADAITTVSEKIIWLLLSPKVLFKLPIQ